MVTKTVYFDGHIIDSLLLAKVLDIIVAAGGDYKIDDLAIGKTANDASHAELEVSAETDEQLEELLAELQVHGLHRGDQ